MNRRSRVVTCFWVGCAVLWVTLDRPATAAETAAAPPAKPVAAAPAEAELDWYDVTQWGVEGRAWPDQQRQRWFDRFPAVGRRQSHGGRVESES